MDVNLVDLNAREPSPVHFCKSTAVGEDIICKTYRSSTW